MNFQIHKLLSKVGEHFPSMSISMFNEYVKCISSSIFASIFMFLVNVIRFLFPFSLGVLSMVKNATFVAYKIVFPI